MYVKARQIRHAGMTVLVWPDAELACMHDRRDDSQQDSHG